MTEITTFGDLVGVYMQLYEQKQLQQLHDVIAQQLDRFPINKPMMIAWQFGLLAELGDSAGAVAMLRDAVNDGVWYHEKVLRESPDMVTLQDIPEFQALVEQCRERRAQAIAAAKPELKVLEPATGTPPYPLLMAIHGNMSGIPEFEPYWNTSALQGWLTAIPQSSQNTWLNDSYVWNDHARGVSEVKAHYETLCGKYAIDPQRVVLSGFSAGGEVAMRSALQNEIPVRGVIGVDGFIFDPAQLEQILAENETPPVRVYLVVSDSQSFVEDGAKVRDMLQQHGIPCELEKTGEPNHWMPTDFDAILHRALQFIFEA